MLAHPGEGVYVPLGGSGGRKPSAERSIWAEVFGPCPCIIEGISYFIVGDRFASVNRCLKLHGMRSVYVKLFRGVVDLRRWGRRGWQLRQQPLQGVRGVSGWLRLRRCDLHIWEFTLHVRLSERDEFGLLASDPPKERMEAPDRGVPTAATGCPPDTACVSGPRDRAGGHGISLEQAAVVQPTIGEVSGYRLLALEAVSM